ncbi:MAG: TVP38/TMEM64 family protein [Clostridia bacterium]|nr:TVP38/TMEM64 family protein [Clostridia bacterium]
MKGKRKWAAYALLAAGLAAAVYALHSSGLLAMMDSREEIHALIDATGTWGYAVYVLLMLLSTVLAPVPSNVTMLAGAAALGFWPAMLLGTAAMLAGSMLVFLAARRLGRAFVRRKLEGGVVDKYLPVIEEKRDMFLFLAMLFPFFPDDVLCIIAGVTSIPTGRFAAIIAAARPWGLVFAALLGSGALSLPLWGYALLGAALIALFIPAMIWSRQIEDWLLGRLRRMIPDCGRGGQEDAV